MIEARNHRINAYKRSVYDIYRDDRFLATVEVNCNAVCGLKVLLGAMQEHGKRLAIEAIRKIGGEVSTHDDSGGTNGAPLPGWAR